MKTNAKHLSKESQDPEHKLYEAFTLINTAEEAKEFLTDLCTPAEIDAMTGRFRVVPLIKQGKSYQKIHAETGVSITTIGRVARFLTLGEGGYNKIYERLADKLNEKQKQIKNRDPKKRTLK